MNITVFTDGSCLTDKDKKVYAGYGIYFPNNEIKSVSRPFLLEPITSQRAELYAIHVAIIKIVTELSSFDSVTIFTDSEYSIKSLTEWVYCWAENGWKKADKKPVKNRDIMEKLYKLLLQHKDKIKFVHVKAHTNQQDPLSIGNSIVDKLALRGAKKSSNKDQQSNFFIKCKPEKHKKIKIDTN